MSRYVHTWRSTIRIYFFIAGPDVVRFAAAESDDRLGACCCAANLAAGLTPAYCGATP